MFFSLLRSHDSFFIFLGLGPLDRSSVVSPGSLSSDDIYSTALGDDKISLALALSILEGLCYFQDWRGVLKVSKQMMTEKVSYSLNRSCLIDAQLQCGQLV